MRMTDDKHQWVAARLTPLPLRGRTKAVLQAHQAERKRLEQAYDKMTMKQQPRHTTVRGRLSERELALVGRVGYAGRR